MSVFLVAGVDSDVGFSGLSVFLVSGVDLDRESVLDFVSFFDAVVFLFLSAIAVKCYVFFVFGQSKYICVAYSSSVDLPETFAEYACLI